MLSKETNPSFYTADNTTVPVVCIANPSHCKHKKGEKNPNAIAVDLFVVGFFHEAVEHALGGNKHSPDLHGISVHIPLYLCSPELKLD